MVDHLFGPVGPVDTDRQIDHARLFARRAKDMCHIGLLGLPFFELQPKVALGMGRAGKDHDARGISVQPMDQQRLGKDRLKPADQAIGQVLSLPRHRQEPMGLHNENQLVIFV